MQPERQSSKVGKKESAKRVPSTDKMVKILKFLPRQESNDLVFWPPRGGALSDATMGKLLRPMHMVDVKAGNTGFVDANTTEIAVPHGIRSTFKNWAIERTNCEWQQSEAALNLSRFGAAFLIT